MKWLSANCQWAATSETLKPAGRGGESDEGDAHMEPRTPSVHASAHTHPNSLTRHPPPRPAALRRSHRSRPEWHLSRGGSSDPGGHVPLGVAGAEAAQRQDLVDGLEVGVGEGEVGGSRRSPRCASGCGCRGSARCARPGSGARPEPAGRRWRPWPPRARRAGRRLRDSSRSCPAASAGRRCACRWLRTGRRAWRCR